MECTLKNPNSMFRNGFDNTQTPNEYNRTERARKKQSTPEYDSVIGQHLLENDQCAANYKEDQFSILDTALSRFHLILLEVSYCAPEYGDLIYAKRKSLFTLLICLSRLLAVATCPIKSRVTISYLIGQRSIASRTSEIADKYHSLL